MKINYFFPEQASTIAPQIDAIYFVLIAVSVFFIVAVAGALVYLAAKYRRKSEDEYGQETHESHLLEIAWSVIPLLIGIGLFAWGTEVFLRAKTIPKDAMEISVVGKQWMWKFQHPDGRREINELHIPLGKPIHLRMISQDVIHSVFVPVFRVKQDVLPMYYTSMWFEPTKIGEYHLHCAEYCGKDHSIMGGRVYVMEPQDYQKWLEADWQTPLTATASMTPLTAAQEVAQGAEEQKSGGAAKAGTQAAQGAKLFVSLTCVTCHGNKAGIGPSLNDVFGTTQALADGSSVKVDDNYIRESILNPTAKVVAGFNPVMPSFQGRVSEEDILKLIAYIKSLRGSK